MAFASGPVVTDTASLADNAVTPAKMSQTGTSGQVLTSNGTSTDPSYQTAAAADPTAFSGVIETDATFVDVTEPFVMPDGSGTFIASIKDAGADTTVELWKVDLSSVVGGSASASITLTGKASPTSIAQSMGYLIIGHEDGISICHPYDTGSWAEATTGWPRSLSTSTTPALTNNDIINVTAKVVPGAASDPRTGGKMPVFGGQYGTGADTVFIVKWDGNVYHDAYVVHTHLGMQFSDTGKVLSAITTDYVVSSDADVASITADDWANGTLNPVLRASAGTGLCLGINTGFVMGAGGQMAAMDTDGLTLCLKESGYDTNTNVNAIVNRTYNSGYTVGNVRGAWLANSKTADRSWSANTLTENGTVTSGSADGASGELLAYSGFSDATNYLSRATDTDWDSIGTGSIYMAAWAKNSGISASANYVISIGNTGLSRRCSIIMDSTGEWGTSIIGATTSIQNASGTIHDDGTWCFVELCNHSSTNHELRVNGVSVDVITTDTGSLTASGDMELSIGAIATTGGAAFEAGSIALARLGVTVPSEAQSRAIYEAEKGMFATGAKVLLQSGTTDAVLDVSVDAKDGKVAVTQTDSMTVWDGLTCSTQATLGANTAFEHLKTWDGTLVEVGATDLSISRPAEIIRSKMDELTELQNQYNGVDLSKAAAWCAINSSGVIEASYNIESVNHESTGTYVFHFGTKMQSKNFVTVLISGTSATGSTGNIISELNGYGSAGAGGGVKTYMTDNASTSPTNTSCSIIVFGELEGE